MEHLDSRFKKVQPAVIAVFKDHDLLEKTLDDLKKKNFNEEDISILAVQRKDLNSISYTKNIYDSVIVGALIGLVQGGVLCWLASLSLIAGPGSATFIAAGPFISAITGAAFGANVGAAAGALIGFGITKIETIKIEKYILKKGVIVSVHVDDPREQLAAKNILVTNGAVKIINPVKVKSDGAPKEKNQAKDSQLIDRFDDGQLH